MKKIAILLAGTAVGGLAAADSVVGVDEMICAAGQVQICVENDTCYPASAADLDIPDFVVIDTRAKKVSTTAASGQNRSTSFTSYSRAEGLIYLQGTESGRAFSFVIDEASGRMTVAVSRDGFSVTVFGACTEQES
ncbi:MAG: hypothetical protein OEW73_13325 [Gammaproteobacteria bacterium]|nr:hypothetical protein [Gammaproteobacteria bacterium]MDH5241754.1 hypothetical protein [Gammaproteobacteria bacterium]MDH5308827.1 hypothetical protein [Gammaproteobacteria bacterium]